MRTGCGGGRHSAKLGTVLVDLLLLLLDLFSLCVSRITA